MIRRWGAWLVWLAGGLSAVGAVLLVIVAVDLLRIPGELESDDGRFQAAPRRQAGLWEIGALPRDLSETLLGLEDDLVYRRTVAMYLKVEPGKVDYEGIPALEALRAKAQYEITRLSQAEPDRKRRSRMLTLAGVLTLDTRLPDEESRRDQVRRALTAFRNAIELDAENADAKRNLEAVLSREGAVVFTPSNAPTSTRAGGKRSGQGRSGSGY